MKIVKIYIDIESKYNGTKEYPEMMRDTNNWNIKEGLIGVLGLEIDTSGKTAKELFFVQKLFPSETDIKYCLRPLSYPLDYIPLFQYTSHPLTKQYTVTWNGRDFDIPIMLSCLNSGDDRISSLPDRDLLDVCVYKYGGAFIKGGLGEVAKRMKINYDTKFKDAPLELFYKTFNFITNKNSDKQSDIYKKSLELVKGRNEFDVRVLPLLEEKLGLLYEPIGDIDKFHKDWNK